MMSIRMKEENEKYFTSLFENGEVPVVDQKIAFKNYYMIYLLKENETYITEMYETKLFEKLFNV